MLPQIATPIGVDLSAGIIEVGILDEGAELRGPIVVCACDDLPCNVRVTLPSAAVEGVAGSGDVDVRRFRILDSDAGPPHTAGIS